MTLRDVVLEQYDEVSAEFVLSSKPEGAQMLGDKWYAPKWGCDTLEHTLDALLSTADSEQREPVAELRKAQRVLLDNLETVEVQARTVTLTVSTALWENWQDDTRHHPNVTPGEQRVGGRKW